MRLAKHKAAVRAGAIVAWMLLPALWCRAQTPAASPIQTPRASTASSPPRGFVLDRIVAAANGEIILESDLDEELRFEQIVPYRDADAVFTREKALQRLIDRMLILQQAAAEPEDAIRDQDLDAQLTRVRDDIPECRQYHCETDAGWADYLAKHGFSALEFRALWKKRMELLRFIEVRFRNGISISDDEIKAYYTDTMLPEYRIRNATPPPLSAISKRIQEVLLQQQVGALLSDWLKSLRAEGSVRVMTPGEAMP